MYKCCYLLFASVAMDHVYKTLCVGGRVSCQLMLISTHVRCHDGPQPPYQCYYDPQLCLKFHLKMPEATHGPSVEAAS